MRQISLCAICLVLSLSGTVCAQQALVEYDEKDDPCAPFKMRILVPSNHVDFKLRVQKLEDGIDPQMVWNPCPQPGPQGAFALVKPAPKRPGDFLAPRLFGFQFPRVKNGKGKQAEFLFP